MGGRLKDVEQLLKRIDELENGKRDGEPQPVVTVEEIDVGTEKMFEETSTVEEPRENKKPMGALPQHGRQSLPRLADVITAFQYLVDAGEIASGLDNRAR
jgi:hypothetical protein